MPLCPYVLRTSRSVRCRTHMPMPAPSTQVPKEHCLLQRTLDVTGRNLEVATDLPCKELVDLAMTWDSRRLPSNGIEVDGMAPPFPQQTAAVGLQMPNQIRPLHAQLGGDSERLANHLTPAKVLLGKRAIGLQGERDGFAKVGARLVKCRALRIGPRELFNEAYVSLGNALEYRREL